MVRTSKGSDAGADDANGCARVSLGSLRPSRTVIPLPASRYGMRHATSSHPPKFGLGTSQSAQGSHRFQACARRPAPAYDPSSRCALAGPEFKPGPVGSDEYLPSTSRGKATACGGLFWATSRPSPCEYWPRFGGSGTSSRALNGGAKWSANLKERLQPCLCAAEDQRVHIVCSFVGVDGLQVCDVAHDVILDLDAVAAVHVA